MVDASTINADNSPTNGNGSAKSDINSPIFNERMMYVMTENALRLTRALHQSYQDSLDKRRNLYHECGYPSSESLTITEYRQLYDRGGIPNRIVGLWPDESWILNPDLYEDEDPEILTTFEKEFKELGNSLRGDSWYEDNEGHPLWEYLNRVDVLSGIGHYGVLLLGIDDGKELSEPADMLPSDAGKKKDKGTATEGIETEEEEEPELDDDGKPIVELTPSTKERELLYIRAFDEGLIQILERDMDPTSRRYMQPVMYGLNFETGPFTATAEAPQAAAESGSKNQELKRVHWSRVIHVADNIESSEIFSIPRLRVHFNRCMDIDKLLGGSGEMYWRGALPPIFFVTHPELGTDVKLESQGAKDSIEQMMSTLQRWGFIPGVTPMQLAPAVSDPSAQIDVQLDAICIKEGCPKRIFLGSERGELASSQDERAWNKRVKRRQYRYVVPRLIVPTIDRLIQLKVLTKPKSYCVKFPDLESLTEAEVADVALKRTQALAAFVAGDCIQMITEKDWWTQEMKVSDEDADGLVDRAAEQMVEIEADEEEERQREMEDFEQQQKIIGENRPTPAGGGGFPPKKT